MTLSVGLCISLLLHSSPSVASVSPSAEKLDQEIQQHSASGFDLLIQNWETTYGTQAVLPLLKIAKDKKKNESKRYIALMGAVRLGGNPLLPELQTFLLDRSWMIRSAALRLMATLGNAETGKAAYPLLRDPALVVRAEAVETIRALRPEGAAQALFETLENPDNYHHGKALWVPQKVLLALVNLKAYETAPKIHLFLESKLIKKDPQFRYLAQRTVTLLTEKAPH